ncbi:MAG TPA: DUF1003 domain-containing protein [Candidatus Polarisedimenticolia bacterium]|nr:DUF1003 domain-containing protein [Candidatus Polarisedimenticolia bacterium]
MTTKTTGGEPTAKRPCSVCGGQFAPRDLVTGWALRPQIGDQIRTEHPDWSPAEPICRTDLAKYRMAYVRSILESEKGELSSLEQDVLESIRKHELISEDLEVDVDEQRTTGQRVADKVATFGGSWAFLISFGGFLALWILVNSLVFLWRPVDPYPFILLNLILSCLAAIQAPIIMMSQNRQEAKDRLRAQHDYKVNLKAELEIRHLHEKIDHLLSHQWERLVQIQEIQLELLNELRAQK